MKLVPLSGLPLVGLPFLRLVGKSAARVTKHCPFAQSAIGQWSVVRTAVPTRGLSFPLPDGVIGGNASLDCQLIFKNQFSLIERSATAGPEAAA